MNHADLLRSFHPCREAADWYNGRDSEQAWQDCHRGDWMLWIAAQLEIDRRLLVAAACDCAELAQPHVQAGEDRPRLAIETARRWCAGEATMGEVRAAYAAHAAYAAAHAAAYAADAAASAADANAYAAAYAADAARRATLRKCADLVRARIPWSVVAAAIAAKAG